MPKVRPLVPVQDAQGKNYAVGEEVDVDDETANAWHAAGKAALIEDEKRNAEAAEHGSYSERITREDTAEGKAPPPEKES